MNVILLAIFSSILLALSFSSFNLWLLAWVGLIPLFFAIEGLKPKQAFWFSYICGFLFFLFSMYWLVFVTAIGWILLSLYQALYFGLFGLFCASVIARSETTKRSLSKLSTSDYRLSTCFIIPATWCVLEYLRSHIGGGIGWNLLAYSQYRNLPVIQISDITGAYGVSFLIVLVNFTIFTLIRTAPGYRDRHKYIFIKPTLAALFIIAVVLIYGQARIRALDRASVSSSQRLKASVIQGNIRQLFKWDAAHRENIKQIYKRLTIEAAKDNPGLIIWPETSVPGYPDEDRALFKYVGDIAKEVKVPLLVGAPMTAILDGKDLGDYNSALLFSKDGKLLQQYSKLHLVMFGEFIPFTRYFPWLKSFLPLTGNFVPGTEYTVFKPSTIDHRPSTNFSVLICFEDIFPGLVRRFVREGADLMVNITNDAWFGKTAAAYQHAANSVFRAVENRRPFVRSANTGFSCFIDATGNIYSKVNSRGRELFIEGYKANTIICISGLPLTAYTKFGDIFVLLCSIAAGAFLIDYVCRRRYNN